MCLWTQDTRINILDTWKDRRMTAVYVHIFSSNSKESPSAKGSSFRAVTQRAAARARRAPLMLKRYIYSALPRDGTLYSETSKNATFVLKARRGTATRVTTRSAPLHLHLLVALALLPYWSQLRGIKNARKLYNACEKEYLSATLIACGYN